MEREEGARRRVRDHSRSSAWHAIGPDGRRPLLGLRARHLHRAHVLPDQRQLPRHAHVRGIQLHEVHAARRCRAAIVLARPKELARAGIEGSRREASNLPTPRVEHGGLRIAIRIGPTSASHPSPLLADAFSCNAAATNSPTSLPHLSGGVHPPRPRPPHRHASAPLPTRPGQSPPPTLTADPSTPGDSRLRSWSPVRAS